ncbi:MAG: hypothetical protein ACOYN2_00740 [Patescibacteria group bacterium]
MKSLITALAISTLLIGSSVSAATPSKTTPAPEVDLSAFETLFNNAMKNPSTVKPAKKATKKVIKPVIKKKIILKRKTS